MKSLATAFLVLLLTGCSSMKTTHKPGSASISVAKIKWKTTSSGDLRYQIYIPPDYSPDSKTRWPLMLFLHGAGERGDDINRVAIHGPLSLVKQGTNFPFIIVAPQCPAGELWGKQPVIPLLDAISKKYRVDPNRVYLTGLSMGGYGTWSLGLSYPEKFAAIAPICGGANLIDVILGTWDKRDELAKLPIWAFHGAKDPVVPVSESQRVVDALKKAGLKDVQLTIYPEAQHDSWKQAYADPKFYEWLLKQSK